jgi:hypothetical protein
MVPSCGARSAGRPTSRDEPPGEMWQVRRWGVTSQELAAVHYEKWGPRQPRKWLCGIRSPPAGSTGLLPSWGSVGPCR